MSFDPLRDFSNFIGGVAAGAGKTAGEFIAGISKPFVSQVAVPTIRDIVRDVTPIIRQETTQAIKDVLPIARKETISFGKEAAAASKEIISEARKEAAAAAKESVTAFLPLAIIGGVVVVGVAAARR